MYLLRNLFAAQEATVRTGHGKHHVFFIHSSVGWCLCYFHILAILNIAVINIKAPVSFRGPNLNSFELIPASGTAWIYGTSIFNF